MNNQINPQPNKIPAATPIQNHAVAPTVKPATSATFTKAQTATSNSIQVKTSTYNAPTRPLASGITSTIPSASTSTAPNEHRIVLGKGIRKHPEMLKHIAGARMNVMRKESRGGGRRVGPSSALRAFR